VLTLVPPNASIGLPCPRKIDGSLGSSSLIFQLPRAWRSGHCKADVHSGANFENAVRQANRLCRGLGRLATNGVSQPQTVGGTQLSGSSRPALAGKSPLLAQRGHSRIREQSRADNFIGQVGIGAGERNRTRVCSLGSRRVFNPSNILAVKLAHIDTNSIKGIHRARKTVWSSCRWPNVRY
jgi:hypothetical protein